MELPARVIELPASAHAAAVSAPSRRTAWLRPLAFPLAISAALLLGWLIATPPVRVVHGNAVSDAVLYQPLAHVLWSPVTVVLDAMSVLSIRQHVALILSVWAGYAALRLTRPRRVRRPWWSTVLRELGGAAAVVGAVIGTYAIGVLALRPMSSLVVVDPDALVIDFHSHTDASHDGRRGFTAKANRAWHAAAGYHVAYVSDHKTQSAIRTAWADNPARAGDGVVLLPAVETRCRGTHLVLLGWMPDESGELCPPVDGSVVSFFTMPGTPSRIADIPGLTGVEVIDAAPRAFDEPPGEWATLHHLADSLGLLRVASSNLHGWGRTSAAWTVLHLPGWPSLSPAELDAAIQRMLLGDDPSVSVIERPRPGQEAITTAGLAAIAPALAVSVLRNLTPAERLAWAAWAWAAFGLWHLVRWRWRLRGAR